jgi:phosphatidylinositol N-acetylglucosaminyltransferase subunit A
MESNTKYSICICTDFVAPKFGGVETHSYQLAQCLIERGHKVIIISNMYAYRREGVRYMANGLKVYHLPMLPILKNDVAFVALFNIVPVLRQILIREHIDLCHGHLSTSVLMA